VKAQSSSFAPQVDRSKRLLTSRFVVSCCPLLSFAVRQVPPSCGPTAAHPGSERPRRTTQRSRFAVEPVFDTLGRWGLGTTQTWAGRSRRRWNDAPSYLVSIWPPSASWPPRSSPTSGWTARRSGASCSLSASSGPKPTSAAGAATSTVDALRPQVCRAHALARLLGSSASWNPDCPILAGPLAVLSRRRFSRAYWARAQLLEQ
jgi:hypothetical protein